MEKDGRRRTRMDDVAARAGVSQMTVSRVIRTPDKVAAATRARVNAAMAELAYVPDMLAGGLAARRSGLIGAVISTFENAIFAETIAGLTETVETEGFSLLLGASGYSLEGEERLLHAILGRRPDGIVLTATLHTPAARQLLVGSGVAIVEAWEIPSDPVDMAVGFDNRAAGQAMTAALLDIGYRRIAFVGATGGRDVRGLRRRDGYRVALAERGLPPREVGSAALPLGIENGPAFLDEILARFPDTDAVFCSLDALAAGILLAARRRGLDVPGRLAVAGFGDFAIAQPSGLDLTTVRIAGRAIGVHAGHLLLGRMSKVPLEETIIDVGFEVVRRSST
ncbi:LacI family DNA-binding transcriptional regulator [Methylobacterium sp. NEAU 140]|uniref:LacI family DNA-binding transcriptional regulator n=1 Tax=Methylobacterium sp. NEAU 140 TaxID=3064945 RepID=UPI00273264A1|nr:LacI family DNA-binding transcriptional regulator [Methylobacterium sp. NEAU 140]MDP4025379.1 LacI family DNA-binding transcriptional regulator [Methylobacterium sp. NEAU 140]